MTDIALTNDERVKALERFGYSPREARFLCLAALHGGCFLRRQYVQFIDKAVGGSAAALIEKALARRHAKSTTFAAGVHIYHLCARPFYRAIGEENNRNRRMHEPASLKAKLMALDFVLAHPEARYLTTEKEKLSYFREGLGLNQALLPSAQYVIGVRKTERFFVEKYPIFLTAGSMSEAPKVSFCFVDEGAATIIGFETFLRKYEPLLSVLPEFDLIYVAATDAHFSAAARAFARLLEPPKETSYGASPSCLIEELLAYFRIRQLIESKTFDLLNRADVTTYRKGSDRFSEQKFEVLYQRWATEGDVAVRVALIPKSSSCEAIRGTLSTWLLEENYDLFSTVAA